MKVVLTILLIAIIATSCTSFSIDEKGIWWTPLFTVSAIPSRTPEPSTSSTVKELSQWVYENIEYVDDYDVWGVEDHWQAPDVTLELGTGDCEDQALLVCYLARKYGIDGVEFRLATCTYKETGEVGDHAFVRYNNMTYDYGDEYTDENKPFTYIKSDTIKYSYENVIREWIPFYEARDGRWPKGYK